MTDAIVGLVVLFFVREAIAVVIFLIMFVLFAYIAEATHNAWLAGVGVVLGWIGVIVWEVFAISWIIGDIIHIVQLAS